MAFGCPAVAVPSLLAVPSAAEGAACLAIGDARRGHFWTARLDAHRLLSAPVLVEAADLREQVAAALDEGRPVFSFEDPARYPLEPALADQVKLEFPSAAGLFRCWRESDETSRAGWAAVIPQPMYLQPPHITPAKRPWLLPVQP